MNQKCGGPAFPTLGDTYMQVADGAWQPKSAYGMEGHPGMTLRAWLSGQALAGMNGSVNYEPADAADIAVKMADEVLKRLEA